ncbi:MAG: hypothetical protein U0271_29840 [Polyangiaceae bacterium]
MVQSRVAGALVAAVLLVGAEREARAGDPAADAFFQEGKRLYAEGFIPEACAKFEESYRLDPLLGALLNLANCREKEGKLATAWSRWGEAVEIAQRSKDTREGFASEHRKGLESRLPKLTIEVRGDLAGAGLELLRDGAVVGAGAAGVAAPIDPGEHVLEVARGDDVLFRQAFTAVEAKGETVTIDVAAVAAATPVGRRAGAPAPRSMKAASAPTSGVSPQLVAGFSVGGVGIAAGIAGFVMGGLALERKNFADQEENCNGSKQCAPSGLDAITDAETFAHVSTGLLVGAGVLFGTGLVLVLTAPRDAEGAALEERASLEPTISVAVAAFPGAASVELRGVFR